MFPERSEVVIIGGGVVGAACAYFLSQEGVETVLLEKTDRGRIETGLVINTAGAWAAWPGSMSPSPPTR